MVREELAESVLEVKRVWDRLMAMKLEVNGSILNIVSAYAPRVNNSMEEKNDFWKDLDGLIESISTEERIVLGADLNGHVGEGNIKREEIIGRYGAGTRNKEGSMVVNFGKRMDLAIVNTYFKKKDEHRVTYKSRGKCTQVDYVMCRRRNVKEMCDCKVILNEYVAKQHRMVVCEMVFMVKKKKAENVKPKIRWWKLKKTSCLFVNREFYNIFVLVRDSGLCLFAEKSLSTNQSELSRNQLYKSFRLIANYFLSRNKIKLDTALFQRRYSGYLAQLVP